MEDRNLSLGFQTRSDTNQTVQLQKLAGDLKFRPEKLKRSAEEIRCIFDDN